MADVKVSFPGGRKIATQIGDHTIVAEQSQESAPSPFDFFLSSMASCTAMTILVFCQNKGIDTTDLKIEMNVEQDDKGFVTKVITQVTRPSDFPEKYIGAIEHITKTCKVKKSIENQPEFEVIVK